MKLPRDAEPSNLRVRGNNHDKNREGHTDRKAAEKRDYDGKYEKIEMTSRLYEE